CRFERAALAAVGGAPRARTDHVVRALAARGARPAGSRRRRLRGALAVVGRQPRRVLGVDLGLLRGGGLAAVRARARRPLDAGREMVPRRAPELRAARLPG